MRGTQSRKQWANSRPVRPSSSWALRRGGGVKGLPMSDSTSRAPADRRVTPASATTGTRCLSRRIVKRAIALAIAGVHLYVVFPSLIRVIGAWPELSTLNPGWVAGAIIAEVAAFACNFGLQRLVLRPRG